jgi:hypothetical protein
MSLFEIILFGLVNKWLLKYSLFIFFIFLSVLGHKMLLCGSVIVIVLEAITNKWLEVVTAQFQLIPCPY